jgi:hypothetical protein
MISESSWSEYKEIKGSGVIPQREMISESSWSEYKEIKQACPSTDDLTSGALEGDVETKDESVAGWSCLCGQAAQHEADSAGTSGPAEKG